MSLAAPSRSLRAILPPAAPLHHRAISSTALACAPPRRANPRPSARPFEFDDQPSLAWMEMFRVQRIEKLVEKVHNDQKMLRACNTNAFVPPTAPIRVKTSIDLAHPDHKFFTKTVLLVPVARLPLPTPEAVHRFKLLAGPRWSPSKPGSAEFFADESVDGKEGWVKISEERFENSVQNRRAASDILDRLVEAASNPESPLPADVPLDYRHLISRHRKKGRKNAYTWAPGQTTMPRRQKVGGVQGFPLEWVPEELREKALEQPSVKATKA
ncbi:hypothetical protein IAT38_008301 [Cryptococcus sp. DSM 104549]